MIIKTEFTNPEGNPSYFGSGIMGWYSTNPKAIRGIPRYGYDININVVMIEYTKTSS